MAAVGIFFLVGGVLTGSVPTVVVGAVFAVVEAGLLVFMVVTFRPARWSGGPDELLAQVADAALSRLDPAWRYDLEIRDGFGATGVHVAAFSHTSRTGPVLWFENPTTFRVTAALPNGDEVSTEVWRTSVAGQERLVEILASLCEGRLTVERDFAYVETAKRPARLPLYPAVNSR